MRHKRNPVRLEYETRYGIVSQRDMLVGERWRSKMLAQLKSFVVDRLDLEELFYLSALGKMVMSEYATRGLTLPEWLKDQLATLDREIIARRRDELEKRLKEIKAQETGLETAESKRARLAREREEIEKQLAGGTVPTTA